MKKPSHEEIATHAYFLYEKAGKPENQSLKFWLSAEMDLHFDWHKHPRKKYFPTWP